MTCAFLQLPREIRELIYEYALFVQSQYVTPTVCKRIVYTRQRRQSKPGSEPAVKAVERLHLVPYSPPQNSDEFSRMTHIPTCGCRLNVHTNTDSPNCRLPLAYGLITVNRQVYDETFGRFWTRNKLFLPELISVPDLLSHMGQKSSRKIQTVCVSLDTEIPIQDDVFDKAISRLSSRYRGGHLTRIEFVVVNFADQYSNMRAKSYSNYLRKMVYLQHIVAKAYTNTESWSSATKVLMMTAPLIKGMEGKTVPKDMDPIRNPAHMCWEAVSCLDDIWRNTMFVNGKKWV